MQPRVVSPPWRWSWLVRLVFFSFLAGGSVAAADTSSDTTRGYTGTAVSPATPAAAVRLGLHRQRRFAGYTGSGRRFAATPAAAVRGYTGSGGSRLHRQRRFAATPAAAGVAATPAAAVRFAATPAAAVRGYTARRRGSPATTAAAGGSRLHRQRRCRGYNGSGSAARGYTGSGGSRLHRQRP